MVDASDERGIKSVEEEADVLVMNGMKRVVSVRAEFGRCRSCCCLEGYRGLKGKKALVA